MELVVKLNATEAIKVLENNTLLGVVKTLEKDEKKVKGESNTTEVKTEKKEVKEEKPKKEPQPVTQTAPIPPTEPIATAAKQYTLDELSVAGATIMQTVGMAKLSELIQSFGVKSLQDLPQDKYNDFALKLRELGAQI